MQLLCYLRTAQAKKSKFGNVMPVLIVFCNLFCIHFLHKYSFRKVKYLMLRKSDAAKLRVTDALKRLALKGEKPDDSVAIRHGLAEGYRRLEELSREWSEEMRGDNHTVMEQIELREADERGKLMRQAAALYERKTGGRLPGDYLEAVKAERALLHGLARHGWDGQREVPKETVEKYGLTRDFAGIARLRWDYHLSEDNGDFSRDYPEAAIGRHNRAIRERAAKELAGLEARLFPEKAASRERKAAHLRADNRASPTASLKRERKEPPGKRQTGETGRRKPPGRRIRM